MLRYQTQLENDDEKLLLLRMNKNYSFPEFDSLSKSLEDTFEIYEEEVDLEKMTALDLVYMEEAKFLSQAHSDELLTVLRMETEVNNEGDTRKGINSDDYQYQKAYNWIVKIGADEELQETLKKESETPTEYDMSKGEGKVFEIFHYKSKKPRRNRRRR